MFQKKIKLQLKLQKKDRGIIKKKKNIGISIIKNYPKYLHTIN